jgi:hypothetical protein
MYCLYFNVLIGSETNKVTKVREEVKIDQERSSEDQAQISTGSFLKSMFCLF